MAHPPVPAEIRQIQRVESAQVVARILHTERRAASHSGRRVDPRVRVRTYQGGPPISPGKSSVAIPDHSDAVGSSKTEFAGVDSASANAWANLAYHTIIEQKVCAPNSKAEATSCAGNLSNGNRPVVAGLRRGAPLQSQCLSTDLPTGCVPG